MRLVLDLSGKLLTIGILKLIYEILHLQENAKEVD